MYTRISTPVKRITPALSAVSTVPRAMAATGSDDQVFRLSPGHEVPEAREAEGGREQGARRLAVPSLRGVADRHVDVDDEERGAQHHQGDAEDEDGPAHHAELREVGRQRPVQRVERRVVRQESRNPEDERADTDQAAGPVGQPDAPERLLHQERDEEQEGAEDDRVGGPEDPDERVRRQDGEELVAADEGERRDLVDAHQHPLDHGEPVVQEPDHDEPQGHLLHRRERLGLEQPLLAGHERLDEGHDVCLAGMNGRLTAPTRLSHVTSTASRSIMPIPAGPEYSVDRIE